MTSESLHVSVPEELKERVGDKLEHSRMTYSDLMQSALKRFLQQYDETVECSDCGGQLHVNALVKTGGECPGCGNDIRGEN